ncbi:MAG TPA: PAS domain-containing protein [Flavobacterium sp.]|nr:PAS domain-containing protein [Flavobacterium sp.]
MLEFKHYDEGISTYLSQLDAKKMPLLTWDFYGDYLNQLSKTITDQHQLTLLALLNSWESNTAVKTQWDVDTVVVVTCPSLKIVFASQNMVRMNGYQPEEVIGHSPKLFQGKATCLKTAKDIGEAIRNQQPFEKKVINYSKDGSLYNCHIKGFPIFNQNGELINFIAFEKAA